MKQIAALIAGVMQNPAALEGLAGDLEGLARRSGFSAADLQRAASVANAVSGAIQSWSGKNGMTRSAIPAIGPVMTIRAANGSPASTYNGVAITAALSLLAVTGAVAVVGTVSVVALAKG
jgi:hypothetical protein